MSSLAFINSRPLAFWPVLAYLVRIWKVHVSRVNIHPFRRSPNFVRILARPVSDTGSVFNVSIIGQSFEPMDLLDRRKFKDFFHEKTGRSDLVLKDIKSLSYWK